MRRLALLAALVPLAAPATARAQIPPEPLAGQQPVGVQQGTGDGSQAGEPGGNGAAARPAAEGQQQQGAGGAAGAGGAGGDRVGNEPRPVANPQPPVANVENRAAPIVEIHGYIRGRFELFQNFSLGWQRASTAMQYNSADLPWYRNPDYSSVWCMPDPGTAPIVAAPGSCSNDTQTSANMRLRLNPEFHPFEWATIHTQVDIFDNLILGSTPEGYYTRSPSPWAPITAFSQTQITPTFGYNGFLDSIVVRRAWAELTSQSLGQIRFGRMPSHWGLGMLANAGNTLDSDYQTTNDRVMYAARLRGSGAFLAAMWDFPSVGATSQNRINENGQGQPYDLSMFDDVHQWIVALGRRLDPEATRAALQRGEVVVNGGIYAVYRSQYLSGEGAARNAGSGEAAITVGSGTGFGSTEYGASLIRRDAWAFIPDLWLQVLGRDFRLEAEAVYIRGGIYNIDVGTPQADRAIISQFGAAIEGEYRLLNNRLKLEFRAGYASGDPDMEGLNFFSGLRAQSRRDPFISLFRFHPDYRIDLIFWRQIMRQFSGAYYFRPSLQYNFIAEPNGELLSARADVIWSRASEFIQTRGNHADLGVELDATLTYQTAHRRDADPQRPTPGLYGILQYGIFLPMGGLGPTDAERATPSMGVGGIQLGAAHTIRAQIGVAF